MLDAPRVADGVPRAVRRAREDLSLSHLERRRHAARSSAPTRGTCPAPRSTSTRWRRRPRCSKGRTTSRRFRRPAARRSDDRASSCIVVRHRADRRPGRSASGRRRPADRLIVYEIAGDGFLRHMVRTIVGTLVEVGRGGAGRGVDRRGARVARSARAGPTAPPQGCSVAVESSGAQFARQMALAAGELASASDAGRVQ